MEYNSKDLDHSFWMEQTFLPCYLCNRSLFVQRYTRTPLMLLILSLVISCGTTETLPVTRLPEGNVKRMMLMPELVKAQERLLLAFVDGRELVQVADNLLEAWEDPKRARDADPLTLATRELVRVTRFIPCKPHQAQKFNDTLRTRLAGLLDDAKLDVFDDA